MHLLKFLLEFKLPEHRQSGANIDSRGVYGEERELKD
jgi:hypothetical protein